MAPAWDKWGDKRCIRDHALLNHVLFHCLKHFLPEETHLVSQKMSFKFDHLDNVHRPPLTLFHQICENLKDQLSKTIGADALQMTTNAFLGLPKDVNHHFPLAQLSSPLQSYHPGYATEYTQYQDKIVYT